MSARSSGNATATGIATGNLAPRLRGICAFRRIGERLGRMRPRAGTGAPGTTMTQMLLSSRGAERRGSAPEIPEIREQVLRCAQDDKKKREGMARKREGIASKEANEDDAGR